MTGTEQSGASLSRGGSAPGDVGSEPVFDAPWEARAFALAVELNARGVFNWSEWAQGLAREIDTPDEAGEPRPYYVCWLSALEGMATGKGITTRDRLEEREVAWLRAAEMTPHGSPVPPPDEV